MHKFGKPTVIVRDLSKTYFLASDGSEKGIFGRRKGRRVIALEKMSLAAYSGQCIGVLGRNGSGKSTFLSLIAGNDKPSTGSILVSSQPTLLGVSAALQGHLTGRANIRLGLLAMGLAPDEAETLIPEVLEWTELVEAADRPMRTYSSGMKSRLKFGISTAVRREILLVDEALSTGDSTFAEKASERMNQFLEESGTVFIVSHAAGTIEKFCDRVLWLHDGELIGDGGTAAMTKMYRTWSRYLARGDLEKAEWVISQQRTAHKTPTILLDSEVSKLLDQKASLQMRS